MTFYKAELVWERFQWNEWNKQHDLVSQPSWDSWFDSDYTFNKLEDIQTRVRMMWKYRKDTYGKDARFLYVRITKYVTSHKDFTRVRDIEDF